MNEQNKNPQPTEENWLDDILEPASQPDEIGPDEQAIASAGLSHPKDAEIDRILEEMKDFSWVSDATEAPEDVDSGDPMTDDTVFLDIPEKYAAVEEIVDEPTMQIPVIPQDLTSDPIELPLESEELPPEEEELPEDAPLPKRRPKMKKGYGFFGIPHILATGVWLAIILVIGVTLGRIVWLCAADVLAFTQTPKDHEIIITISEEDTLDEIAQQLKEAELIRYPELFKLFAEVTGKDERISVGTFTLNKADSEGKIPGTIYDYSALINALREQAPTRNVVEIMFPEGYSCAQVFNLLAEHGVCTVEELEDYAANGELNDYWFLKDVQRGSKYCLEGYLFPDTYQFYTNDDPERVLEKFLNNFENQFSERMIERLGELNERLNTMMKNAGRSQEYIDSHQMTVAKVVNVASMVEKEAANSIENFTVASVIYNRLCRWELPYLNIDATIVYALGGKTDPLTLSDLQIDSPYNTYTHMGLPAGPISNPGLASLNAALDPDDTDFFYYALNPSTNEHKFSKTEAEHQKFLDSLKDDE